MFIFFLFVAACGGIASADEPSIFASTGSALHASGVAREHGGVMLAPPLFLSAMGAACPRRRRRVCVYCRFSTEQQNEQSLADQEAACRRHLQRLDLGDVDVEVIADAATSGELAHRTGVDTLWAAIESGSCDVIIVEEISRIYRHATRAMQFVEAAVDVGIRVIGVNDSLDTDREDWCLNGHFASIKAELDNRQTRQRIHRSIEGRWEAGLVCNQTIRPGYFRLPVHAPAGDLSAYERYPDTARKSGVPYQKLRGPFIEKRDDRWTQVIHRAFELVTRGDPDGRSRARPAFYSGGQR